MYYIGFKGVTNAAKKEQGSEIPTPAANTGDADLGQIGEKTANKRSSVQ